MRTINRETHWFLAGIVYFAAVFAAGFILGIIRVGFLVPQIGVRVAELMEMPLMIVATIIAARWVVYCWGVALAKSAALLVGIWAFSLLVTAEIAIGALQALPLSNFILGRDPVSGTAYFAALALFALMPWIVARGAERRAAGLIDEFIGNADILENHEILVHAPAGMVFDVAEHFDLISMPLTRAIFRLRELVFRVKAPPRVAKSIVAETLALGWRMLAYRPGRELVMGAATQPWVGDVKFRGIPSPAFADFSEPNMVKIAWTFEVEPLGPQTTRFRSQTRVLATDDNARRKFLRYWVFAGVFIVLIRKLANRAIRRAAERRFSTAAQTKPHVV